MELIQEQLLEENKHLKVKISKLEKEISNNGKKESNYNSEVKIIDGLYCVSPEWFKILLQEASRD